MSKANTIEYGPEMGELKDLERIKRVFGGKSIEEQQKYFSPPGEHHGLIRAIRLCMKPLDSKHCRYSDRDGSYDYKVEYVKPE